mmetsp:Transcript_35508/g.57132  ORF Transcript_35508/g.57132 Transcript_35508/m.57132 type:complete len:296 (-) Transcript_35508:173-1060(-)
MRCRDFVLEPSATSSPASIVFPPFPGRTRAFAKHRGKASAASNLASSAAWPASAAVAVAAAAGAGVSGHAPALCRAPGVARASASCAGPRSGDVQVLSPAAGNVSCYETCNAVAPPKGESSVEDLLICCDSRPVEWPSLPASTTGRPKPYGKPSARTPLSLGSRPPRRKHSVRCSPNVPGEMCVGPLEHGLVPLLATATDIGVASVRMPAPAQMSVDPVGAWRLLPRQSLGVVLWHSVPRDSVQPKPDCQPAAVLGSAASIAAFAAAALPAAAAVSAPAPALEPRRPLSSRASAW